MVYEGTDYQTRRNERIIRERKRKKRMRRAIWIIVIVAILLMGALAYFMHMNAKNSGDGDVQVIENDGTAAQQVTAEPVEDSGFVMPQASEQNDMIDIIADSGQVKTAYLTFDDGPTPEITPQVLDILRRYNVNATFFMVGKLVDANPQLARRVWENGNLIANHSYEHEYDSLYTSTETFMDEINRCEDSLLSVVGPDVNLFRLVRFPGGSYNSSADSHAPVKQECKIALAEQGYYYCDWNSLNGDAEGKQKNAGELVDYFVNSAQGYNNLIVLMHDAATKQETVNALPSIIEYLINEGYTFKTLDDVSP